MTSFDKEGFINPNQINGRRFDLYDFGGMPMQLYMPVLVHVMGCTLMYSVGSMVVRMLYIGL